MTVCYTKSMGCPPRKLCIQKQSFVIDKLSPSATNSILYVQEQVNFLG